MSFADLDGKDEEPTAFLRNALSAYTPNEGSKPYLDALPDSVVLRIVSFCTRREVIGLASLCRRFNELIPTHIFSQSQMDILSKNASVVFSMDVYGGKLNTDPDHLVPHLLAISFWIKSVDVIRYQFGSPLENTVRDMGHLAGLISRMPMASIRELHIDFRPVDFGYYSLRGNRLEKDVRKWETAVDRLTRAAQTRRVKEVFLLNGRYLADMLGLNNPPNRAPRPSQSHGQTNGYGSPNNQPSRIPPPISRPSAVPKPSRFKGLFSGLGRATGHKPSLSMSQIPSSTPTQPAPSKTSFDNFLPSVPSVPLGLSFMPADVQKPDAPSPPTPQALEPQTPKPTTVARVNPLFHPKPYEDSRGIQALHLTATVFLTSNYVQSTAKFIMMRPSSMTTLSLTDLDLDLSIWKTFLDAIHLPNLANFTIRSSSTVQKAGAAASDLIYFLLLHRAIAHLDIHGMSVPSYIDELIEAQTFLPSLSHLSAHPTYVSVIVANHTHKPSFRSPLTSIKITTESYGRLHPLFSHKPSQPAMILKALGHIAHLVGPIELRLGFSLNDISHVTWIEEAVRTDRLAAASSICARLHAVKRLSLDCGYEVTFSDTQLTVVLPAFFNTFPELEAVYLRDMGSCATMSGSEIRELWVRMCPNVRRFEVTNVWKAWSYEPRASLGVDDTQDESTVGTSEQAIG